MLYNEPTYSWDFDQQSLVASHTRSSTLAVLSFRFPTVGDSLPPDLTMGKVSGSCAVSLYEQLATGCLFMSMLISLPWTGTSPVGTNPLQSYISARIAQCIEHVELWQMQER